MTYPDKIRALRIRSDKLGSEAAGLRTAKFLRVLDLEECAIQKLPSSIGQLKFLRYLNTPEIKYRMLPSCITKLPKLIYLNLHGSSAILSLPESIGEMKDLMYLDLSGCLEIRELPNSVGKLTQLQHLNLSGCKRLEKLPESFGKLENLIHLDLSFSCYQLSDTKETLLNLTKLQSLNLSGELKGIFGEWYRPSTLGLSETIGRCIELRYLNLSGCLSDSFTTDSVLDIIGTLSNLEHLVLSNNFVINIPDISSLKKLHTLDLTGCLLLEQLPEKIADMENLKFLIVNECSCLDRSSLPINKSLTPLPFFPVHVAEGEQSSNLFKLEHADPSELEISCLENVRSAEEAQRIELRDKGSMLNLKLEWTVGKKRYVEDIELLRRLVPASSLEEFWLRGYNSVSLPTWMVDMVHYLPNLVKVVLSGLSECDRLPPLGQLPQLVFLMLEEIPRIVKIDRDFCGSGVKAFSSLETLYIFNMEGLEEWRAAYSCGKGAADEFMFPNLKSLITHGCHKLRVKPCPPRVKGTWHITDSDSVLLQWGDESPDTGASTSSALVDALWVESCAVPMHRWNLFHHLPALRQLTIKHCNCEDLRSSPEIMGALCSLQKLKLLSCDNLKILPEGMEHLISLQSLHLEYCPSIEALPERLGDLVSLKDLYIWYCKGIVSLPESIQQLTNLQILCISSCPALKGWCELEKNKAKISHIKRINY